MISQLQLLENRFNEHTYRHADISWEKVEEKLSNNEDKLEILIKMDETGGEPDVVGYDSVSNQFIFFDCSKESPVERRSLCYDRKALDSRKLHKPKTSVIDLANEIGIELLTEEDYRYLQTLGEFDLKTSSWIQTPKEVRELGGAIFGDRRFNRVFIYHNGAESYYAGRGFRGKIFI